VGLIWLKKLLSQYNNAWLGRKAKLKVYEDAKVQVLQDIEAKLAGESLSEEEREALTEAKGFLAS